MEISIIVPCRNEGANVVTLADRIGQALAGLPELRYELLFVDDSDDETPLLLDRLSRERPHIRYRHREEGSGLSSAILEGFRLARGFWFIVMDADLQHPPESLPALVREMRAETADVIVPSRFVPGGSDGGLNPWRKFVSWTARALARLFVKKVRRVTDPTSGYFAIRREVAFSRPLNPIGWKLLLELLVRSDYERVREIPYSFEARDLGSSKFNMREQWNYVRHLGRLIKSSEPDYRFWKFCLVGASGVVVNTAVYAPLVKLGMPVSAAFAVATAAATLSNFIWNNRFTWTHAKHDRLWQRIAKFTIVSLGGLLLSSLSVAAAHRYLHAHYLVAGFIGIVVSTGWNFAFNNSWTFRLAPKAKRETTRETTLSHRGR